MSDYLEHSERSRHHRQPRAWHVSGAVNEGSLPPDTLAATTEATQCVNEWHTDQGPWKCCRPRGHSGRHYAGDGTHVLAVWP